MAKFTQLVVDALKDWFATGHSFTDRRAEDFIRAIAHGITGHGHSAYGGEGDTAGDAAGVWNIQAGSYAEMPASPERGDLYIATDQRALYGCFKKGQWTRIGECALLTPLAYRAKGPGATDRIWFHTGIPPDTTVFSTSFPDTWSLLQEPRAIRADSNRYVTWSAYHSGQKERKVLFSRSEDAGATFSPPVAVSDLANEPTARHMAPDLSIDLYGFLHLTWYGQYLGLLYYSKSLDQGVTWTTPLVISPGSPSIYRPPRIAVHGGGQYIVILMKTAAGNLYVYRSEDFGNTFPYQVSIPAGGIPGSTGAEYDLRFAGNLLYGASTDTERLYLFRSPDYGATWLVLPRQPSGTIKNGYMPLAIAARENKLWVVYPYWADEEWNTSAVDCYFTLDDFESWDWARIYGPTEEWLSDTSIELLATRLHATYHDSSSPTLQRSLSADEGATWEPYSTIIDLDPPEAIRGPVIAELYELA